MGTALKIILCILALILFLAIVVIIRAVAGKKSLSKNEPAIKWTEAEAKHYAESLSAMIKVPTVSKKKGEAYPEFLKLQEVMAELYPNVFSKLEKHDIDGNLLRCWRGKNPSLDGILLMGHQDVVPAAEKEWKHDPFSGIIEQGKINGRGAMDCKSTVCAEFSAVEELLAEGFQPERDVWLSSSVNEENSGGGSETAVEYLKSNGIRLCVVMDEGGAVMTNLFPGLSYPCAGVGIVEKGFTNLKIIARGAGGHASTPPKNTPIVRLSKFMCEVEKTSPFKKEMTKPIREMFAAVAPYLSFPMRIIFCNMWLFSGLVTKLLPKISSMAGAFVQTTAAFTMCSGSEAANVIPDYAYVVCNIRPSVHQNSDESVAVLRKIAKKYNLETEIMMGRDASNTADTSSAEFIYLKNCITACLPDCVPAPYLMTGGTDCRQYEKVCDNCLRFTPTRLSPEQLAAMHSANENLDVSALAEAVKFYKYFLKNHN